MWLVEPSRPQGRAITVARVSAASVGGRRRRGRGWVEASWPWDVKEADLRCGGGEQRSIEHGVADVIAGVARKRRPKAGGP